jgi:hypothetical protein
MSIGPPFELINSGVAGNYGGLEMEILKSMKMYDLCGFDEYQD